jgi:hypothetical protein
MPKLIFFHDVMDNGGTATDLDRGDARLYHHRSEKGRVGKDSTLRWQVSLWCGGEGVPDDPGEARDWLLRHEAVIRGGVLACASEFDSRPDDPDPRKWVRFSWDRFPERVPGVRMTLFGGKDRELCPLPLSSLLRGVAADWRPLIEALEADDPAS